MLRVAPENFHDRTKYARGGIRLNSRVKIAVQWVQNGETGRAEGYTVDVSPKGCLAVVPQELEVGQRVKLINLINKNEADAILIWRGHEGRTGWELGLELQNAAADYWGIEF